jgi:hypothetical protein
MEYESYQNLKFIFVKVKWPFMEIILQKTQSVDWGKGNMVCESIL